MEHRPGQLAEFFDKARPKRERLRLVAHALGGPVLKETSGAKRSLFPRSKSHSKMQHASKSG